MQKESVAGSEAVQASEQRIDAPVSPLKVPTGSGISFGTSVVITVMTTLIINVSMLVAYDHFLARKFISVDVKGYVEKQKELYLAGKINNEELEKNYKALEVVVKAIPKNRVILMGDAVLGGVEKIDLSILPSK